MGNDDGNHDDDDVDAGDDSDDDDDDDVDAGDDSDDDGCGVDNDDDNSKFLVILAISHTESDLMPNLET